MPLALVPFGNQQQSSYDELTGASPVAMNVITDPRGAIRRRPGIATTSLAVSSVVDATGIVGLFMTNHRQLYAVAAGPAERTIYIVNADVASAVGGGAVPSGLRGLRRPVFAETELLLVIAGGDVMEKVVLASATGDRLGGNPPNATHVISNATRLLANDILVDRTKVRFSDTALGDTSYAGHEVWSLGGIGTSGYFTAEARPYDVVALVDNMNEVWVVTTGTTQVFQPDPQITYAPVATTELGLAAPYSVVKVDQQFMWLDHLRRLVMTDGRSFQDTSGPIQSTLQGIATVDDAFGYRVNEGFLDGVVETFPTDGRTFCFQKGSGWAQWAGWSDAVNNWAPFPVLSSCLTPAWSLRDGQSSSVARTLVGTTDGHIGQLDMAANTDLGTKIVAYVRTGFLNRETDKLKHCRSVHFALRRGETTPKGSVVKVRWSDRPGEWNAPVFLELGASGDREIVVPLRSLGTYRRRQWELEFSGPEALSLVGATEEYDVLAA